MSHKISRESPLYIVVKNIVSAGWQKETVQSPSRLATTRLKNDSYLGAPSVLKAYDKRLAVVCSIRVR